MLQTILMPNTLNINAIMELPLTITDVAHHKITEIIQHKQIGKNYALRIGIKGGGCSGFNFILGFDTEKESDQVYIMNGLKVLIDKKELMHVMGKEIDYVQEGTVSGFVFQ